MGNQSNEKKAKIIQFPNLKERLLEKGLEAIQNKNFSKALDLLSQAKENEIQDPELEFGIVLCLFELGRLAEAKLACKKMLLEDVGDYYKVLQFYLTILIQLGEYNEVQSTLEAVFEEDRVPPQYAENLFNLLEFSRKFNKPIEEPTDKYDLPDKIDTIRKTLLVGKDKTAQLKVIQSLKDSNISKYMELVQTFLEDADKDLILKTMILQLLIDHSIDKEVNVEKMGKYIIVIPSKLRDISEEEYAIKVLDCLEDNLGNENPSLFEVVKEIWLRHLYVIYPFTPNDYESNVWSAALHMYGNELHGAIIENGEIENLYGVKEQKVNKALILIKKIEKISFFEI